MTAIAHDLRTPLFTLRGSLEAIEHGIGDSDHLRRAQDKATLLDGLVDDLFTYSRLEYAGPSWPASRSTPSRSPARPPRRSTRASSSPRRRAGTWSTPTAAALLRVLVNLLDNAVRHARTPSS